MKSRPYAQLLYLLVICALVFGQPVAAGSFRSTRAFSARISSPAAGVFDSPLPQPSPTPPAEPPTESQDCPAQASDDAVLRVSFSAAETRPGQEAALSWTVLNCRPANLEGAQLTYVIPEGFTLSPQDVPAPLSYNPSTRTVSGGLPLLAAGAILTGQFPLRVTGLRAGDMIAVIGEVKDAAGAIIDQHSAELRVTSPAVSVTQIGAQGGVIELEDGRVRLAFQPGAVVARSQVQARPVGHPTEAPAYIGRGYEFVVRDPDGQERHAFTASPILTLQYELDELLPDALYLQGADGQWQRLPTERDAKARTLRAALPHLSVVADGTDIMPAVLPTLRGAQHDLFSGAAVVNYDIPVPPAAGGLAPMLALQYNSASQQNDPGHGSALGAGWNITVDSWIADSWFFGGNGAPTIWRIDGVSYTEGAGADGALYLNEAPDWRIMRNNTQATAYSPDGRRYNFRRAFYRVWRLSPDTVVRETTKWLLTSVEDASGNHIWYDYAQEVDTRPDDPFPQPEVFEAEYHNFQDNGVPLWHAYDLNGQFVHYLFQNPLKTVTYNTANDTDVDVTQIQFVYASEVRRDFSGNSNDECSTSANKKQYFHTNRLLTGIKIRQLRPDWSGHDLVAGYKLGYEDDPWGDPNCARRLRYSLDTIAECAAEDANGGLSNCLPATRFTYDRKDYDQNGRLTQVDNGYGGQVVYAYELAFPAVVTRKTINDAVTNTSHVWTYSYSGEIRDTWFLDPVAFTFVTEALPSSLGAGSTIYHEFLAGDNQNLRGLRGRESLWRATDRDVKQEEVYRNWVADATNIYGAANLVRLDYEDRRIYTDGVSYETQRTQYAYDLEPGQTRQYGNPTRIYEYSDAGSTLYRTIERWYRPRDDTPSGYYVVHALAHEKLWQGAPGSGTCVGQRVYLYDRADHPVNGYALWSNPPQAGLLTDVWEAGNNGNQCDANWVRSATYDYQNGNHWRETWPNGTTITRTYDAQRHAFVVNETTQFTRTLTTAFHYYGINPLTDEVPHLAGRFGQLQAQVDPNAATTRHGYDTWGRVTATVRPGDSNAYPTTTYQYKDETPYRVIASQRDVSGTAASMPVVSIYDGKGQRLQVKQESQEGTQQTVTQYAYNALGLLEKTYAPFFATYMAGDPAFWTRAALPGDQAFALQRYDTLGRIIEARQPGAINAATVAYAGRTATYQDENAHRRVETQDAFGRLAQVDEYTGSGGQQPYALYSTTRYEYDAADRLEWVRSPAPMPPTNIAYDLRGHKLSITDPDLGTWRYTYDGNGNLQSQTDARGVQVWFSYDGLNRLATKREGSATGRLRAEYIYDESGAGASLGRRTRMGAYEADGEGLLGGHNSATWSYDARGRVITETVEINDVPFTTSYAYDAADRPTTTTLPDTEVITTTYNAAGWPTTLKAGSTELVNSVTYDAAGRALDMRLAAGNLWRRQNFSPWNDPSGNGRLQGILVGPQPGTGTILNLAYEYDPVGNVRGLTDAGTRSAFEYDDLDRLTDAYGQDFHYDVFGRFTLFAGSGYTPDSQHPHAVDKVVGQDRYDYDPNGNMVVRHKGLSDQQTLAWDAENRLTGVFAPRPPSSGGGGPAAPPAGTHRVYLPMVSHEKPIEAYSYDADGRRVMRARDAETTVYVNPAYEVTLRAGGPTTVTKHYTFGGQRIAMREGQGPFTYLHTDHLGSTLAATDSNGTTIGGNQPRYHAYGAQRVPSVANLPTSYTYTGQRWDAGSRLMYFGARYYDSDLGIFIQPDTIVPDPLRLNDLNRYTYSRNSPLTYLDKDGHFAFVPLLIIGGIALLKTIDYGWTAYDAYQSLKVVNGPNASAAARNEAAANLAMAAAFEAAEPDDLLPVSLPLDDLARKGILRIGKEAGERAGKEATGQIHHLISEKISRALSQHPTLAAKLARADSRLQYRAANAASHRGYQAWHRAVDEEVVQWLQDPQNSKATSEDFVQFLQDLYHRPDIRERIPDVDLSGVLRDLQDILQ